MESMCFYSQISYRDAFAFETPPSQTPFAAPFPLTRATGSTCTTRRNTIPGWDNFRPLAFNTGTADLLAGMAAASFPPCPFTAYQNGFLRGG